MANCGVSFGGVDLGSISPHFRLIDVIVGAPDISAQAHDLAGANGQVFASQKYGARSIEIIFDIQDPSERRRVDALIALRGLLNTKKAKPFRDATFGARYLNAVCTTFPTASELEWAEDLTIELTAFDPLWYSDATDIDLPLGSETEVYVDCTEEVCPIIAQTLVAAVTDPTWTCSNGQYIMLQGSVGPGVLVIDCTRHHEAITLNGADILIQMALDSEFFRLSPRVPARDEPHIITTANGAGGTLAAKYRWL